MYCTQQMIQGGNFRDWLKTAKTTKVFPLKSFATYGIYRRSRAPTSVINGIQLAKRFQLHLLMCILICKAFN